MSNNPYAPPAYGYEQDRSAPSSGYATASATTPQPYTGPGNPYAPTPTRLAHPGGYGFDYNFGLNDDREDEDARRRADASGSRPEASPYLQPGNNINSNSNAPPSAAAGPSSGTGYEQDYYRPSGSVSGSGHMQPPAMQRSPSAASTSSKTELTGTQVHVTKAHDFGPEYPDGWTQEDMEAEKEFLKAGLFNWRDLRDWRFWIRAKWWYYYVALVIIIVLVVLMTVYHDQIVEWCEPAANWMKDLPGGWAIPIGILFVISFPPLFGHEIVAIICGLVWGLWIGFGIVAAGTFLGEVGNYYAFKYCCRSRAEKYERKNMAYACLAYTMREGSLWIIIAARLSAIPGHLTTAVFSTCGMNIWIFMLGAFLTLPKQLITVYLGVIFKNQNTSTKNKIISYTVLAVGFLITVAAAWWIWYEMHKVRVIVWRKRRMEMASRGISLSELSHKDDLEAAPMLAVDPAHAGHDHSPHHQRHLRNGPNHPANPYASPTEYSLAPPHTTDGLRDLGARDKMRASYQTPYDINYRKTGDDMSVYHVDPMAERLNLEADIAERINTYGSPTRQAQQQAFPQAQASGLRREPSAASAFYRPGDARPEVIPSSFPAANPYTR